MSFLDKLERRIGWLAVPGLVRMLVAFNALVFVLVWMNPDFASVVALDPVAIRHGEVWRLVTYIFLPQTLSPLWILFALLFLWFIGEGLERAWGAFRVTLYFFVGMIGTTIAAFFFGTNLSNAMLLASLFFAFARLYPDEIIYAFFVLPLKVKWIAWFAAAILMLGFVTGSHAYRMALVAAFANFGLFFGPEIFGEFRHRREVSTRRRRFEIHSRDPEAEPLHRCAVCGATELTNPDLDFRVARDGEEYCTAHLPSMQVAGR